MSTLDTRRAQLDTLYASLNHRVEVHPDPLETLYPYADISDREVVGLLAAALAFGGVRQILISIQAVLSKMGPSPRAYLEQTPPRDLRKQHRPFRHRWVDGAALADFLIMIRTTVRQYGSLKACFLEAYDPEAETVGPALTAFVGALRGQSPRNPLLSDPAAGSACKRLHLFLRWMVRQDEVDPGGWSAVSPSQLLIPLDTHMHRIGRDMGLTRRNSADMRTVLEVTKGFRKLRPDDPVRYDFALTRLGMRRDRPELDKLMAAGFLRA